jgi:hypothetical protein
MGLNLMIFLAADLDSSWQSKFRASLSLAHVCMLIDAHATDKGIPESETQSFV